MEQDGRRLLAYDGTGVGTGLGLSFLPGAGGNACTTTFEIEGGRVTGFTRAGPDCD